MIMIKKNQGRNAQYELTGTKLAIREGELTLDLSRYEREYPVHLDIGENAFGMLVMGPSRRYIAEIDIPAREYKIEIGEKDDLGFPKMTRKDMPFDVDKVSLTLWAVEV
jgi:hypothetical protein